MARFVYSAPTQSETFRSRERPKQQARVCELSSDGSPNIALKAWLDSFGGNAKIAGAKSCRQKQWN